MNAESIPEGPPKDSSIINLPKPEIGGDVESVEEIQSGMEKDEILNEEIKENIREFSFNLFSKILLEKSDVTNYGVEEVEDNIRDIIYGKNEDYDIFIYDDKYREAIKIFLDEYLNFTRSNKEDENYEVFLKISSEILFYMSPNITEAVSVSDNFDFIVKANRLRDSQKFIGYHAFSEIEEKFSHSFDKNIAHYILNKYNESSISEKFDILHVIEKLYSNCMSSGSLGEDALFGYEHLINDIDNNNKSHFIECYIELIKKRIDKDYEKKFSHGNMNHSDIDENDEYDREQRESENIKEIVRLNISIDPSEKTMQIGDGVVALYNENGIPMKFAQIDKSLLNENYPTISNYDIKRIKETMKFSSGDPYIELDYFFDYFSKNILKPYYNIDEKNNEILAEKWEGIFENQITKEDLLEFIELKQEASKINEETSQFRNKKMLEINIADDRERNEFYEYFKESAEKFISFKNNGNNELQIFYNEYLNYYKEKNYKMMTVAMNNFMISLREILFYVDLTQTDQQKKVYNEMIELHDKYSNLCEYKNNLEKDTEDDVKKYIADNIPEFKSVQSKLYEIGDKILPNNENLVRNVNKEIEKIELEKIKKQNETEPIQVEFLDYQEFAESHGSVVESKSSEEEGLLYQHLHRLKLSGYIEYEFNIDFKKIPFVYQIHFLDLLSSKSEEEINKVKEFLNQGQDSEAKNNRIKSFLSLESGEEMGNVILSIGENLKDQPKIADLLFSKYAKTVDNINENSEEISKLYKEIFFEKEIDKSEVAQAILKRSKELLLDGSEKLENADEENKLEIIKDLLKSFEEQQNANKKELDEFRSVAEKLNEKYLEISSFGLNREDIEDFNKFERDMIKGKISVELNLKEDQTERLREMSEKHKRYDSQRIREMIDSYKQESDSDHFMEVLKGLDLSEEKKEKMKESFEQDYREIFLPIIEKLEQLLPFQTAFEKKLEKIIYGHEAVSLPEDLFDDMDGKIENLEPEEVPSEEKQIYLPVGISSNLPEWENILNGKEKMAKPMDIYGYMFWLNNQEKNVKLVICDQMQASNYESLYGKSHNEAVEATKKIGEKEKRFYQRIINTFGLDNVEIVDYESFIDKQGEKFKKYKNLCNSLSSDDIWKEAFLGMVQESVSEKDPKDGKDKYLPYAIDELSWILGYDGVKVSHINEARYDALALIIKNVEKVANENNIDIFNLDDQEKEKLKPIINCVIQCARNMLNTKKLNLEKEKDKDSPEVQYYKKMHEVVGKIKKSDTVQVMKIKNNKIKIDFISPADLGSRSFGRRRKGENEKTEDVIKFKEAYSTYFCKGGADMFLESDQVVASSKGHIGGKILTFEKDLQIKYVKEVIKPILVQYFKTLEKAPDEYFEKTKKTKKELLAECKNSQTLSELLKFIQKNIMEPTFSE